VVNTTALGMVGKPEFALSLDQINPAALVNDLVYTPLDTHFLQSAAARGCRTVDGLGMLLHQAAPGFERWFGHRPEVDQATRDVVLGT
jgi:shikimate dehydrogenase